MDLDAAIAYAEKHDLRALIVARGTDVLLERYGERTKPDAAQPLYSGTKSFWGPAALRAQDDGLLSLDERVAETFRAWSEDPWKRRITLRMLLSLTAGFGFGGLGASVPPYEKALAMVPKSEPGTKFAYGGIQLQIFGAVLARKLEPRNLTPQQYLRERVLEPARVAVGAWRSLSDKTEPLPTGASLTARNWLAYGRSILHERENLAPCFEGSAANARYGLGWWIGAAGAPDDLIYASGAGGQALYLIPSQELIAVHFGKSNSWKHETFLKKLL
jgi:CubicO group peptidase (beta-lactamase class C family)